jgi:hypothetical protein
MRSLSTRSHLVQSLPQLVIRGRVSPCHRPTTASTTCPDGLTCHSVVSGPDQDDAAWRFRSGPPSASGACFLSS